MSAASRIAYLNGQFLPLAEARIPIMDRGFLFGDGIYEVTAVINGRLIDNAPHLARLDRSLREIGIANPHDLAGWTAIQIYKWAVLPDGRLLEALREVSV